MCLEKEQGYFNTKARGGQCREKYFTEKISELHLMSVLSLSTTFNFSFLLPIFIIQLCNNSIPETFFFWMDRHRLYASASLSQLVGVPTSHSYCTSSTATSCPFRSRRKVRGCFESSPKMTSQPRRGIETMCVFRSVLSLWKMSLLSFTLHQRSRQRLLESTLRYPAIKWNVRYFTPDFFWKGKKKNNLLLGVMLALT